MHLYSSLVLNTAIISLLVFMSWLSLYSCKIFFVLEKNNSLTWQHSSPTTFFQLSLFLTRRRGLFSHEVICDLLCPVVNFSFVRQPSSWRPSLCHSGDKKPEIASINCKMAPAWVLAISIYRILTMWTISWWWCVDYGDDWPNQTFFATLRDRSQSDKLVLFGQIQPVFVAWVTSLVRIDF